MKDITTVVHVDLDGKVIPEYQVWGMGGNGIVIRKDQLAIKLPNITRESEVNEDGLHVPKRPLSPLEEGEYDERIAMRKVFAIEKSAYRRLGDHDGIIKCLNAWSDDYSIEMPFMEKGDLYHYLAQNRPDKSRQLSWLAQIAHTLVYIHSKRILMTDIGLHNMLLDDNLAIQFCDFGNATVMPLDWDLKGTDEDGYSIQSDIGAFGALMYQIVSNKSCQFDLFHEWKEPGDPLTWPPRDTLPPTQDVWLGDVIEKCWTKGFESTQDLAAELDRIVAD